MMLISVFAFILFTAWAPWMPKKQAEDVFSRVFSSGKLKEIAACSMRCNYCGVGEPKKVPFGYEFTFKSSCEKVSDGSTTTTLHNIFLSAIGTVHGL